jgi:hypothetical protein
VDAKEIMPSWRTVYLSLLLALMVGGAWVASETRYGVRGYGENLLGRARRDSAMADSIALAVELARRAVIQADSNNAETRRGVEEIKVTLERMAKRAERVQVAQTRAVVAKVESLNTTVDSIQKSIPAPPFSPITPPRKGNR